MNRALILEEEAARRYGYEPVNVVPQLKAGGSFATAAYHAMEHPVAVEEIRADGGMDIGDTLIGMHLKPVAVPVRISVKRIGGANVVCARVRPKFIGGERAGYDPGTGIKKRIQDFNFRKKAWEAAADKISAAASRAFSFLKRIPHDISGRFVIFSKIILF